MNTTAVKSDFVIRKFYIDSDNILLIKSNDKLIHVKLHLKGDKIRHIGTVTKSTRTIEMRRKKDKHLYRIGNAYGFNDFILRHQTTFDWVRLSDDQGNHWKVPVQFILTSDQSKYLHFQKQGFELQRFISLENLEHFRVKPEENRRF